MDVVVVTAEPRGAYHLAPLASSFKRTHARFTHLVPYPEPVQGPVAEAVTVTADYGVLDNCDRLVVTGGKFSAWTEFVARRAVGLGVPVVFSELAYVTTGLVPRTPLFFEQVTALSPNGAECVSRYLQVPRSSVFVSGTPALDGAPEWEPNEREVVLFSTVDAANRDPSFLLRSSALMLQEEGWSVRVRVHPREDVSYWQGFSIVSEETVPVSAARASVVVGYPGTAMVLALAVGVPVVSVAPTEELRQVLTARQRAAIAQHPESVTAVVDAVKCAQRPKPKLVAPLVGPLGGSGDRIVGVWSSPPLQR